MTETIVPFSGITKRPLSPETVLAGAIEADLRDVLVLGWQGDELYIAASRGRVGELLILMEMAKRQLLDNLSPATDDIA